jgi:hypothetical protein
MWREKLAVLITGIALLLLPMSESHAQAPLGTAPTFSTRQLTAVPNAQAIQKQIWLPGIDDGYVPQGIVFFDNKLFVSSYRSTDPKQDRGPCRLFALDANKGAMLGHLDLPESCGHAGGLTATPSRRLIVSDSRVIFEIEPSFAGGKQIGRVTRSVRLRGAVKGSFTAAEADGFWLGQYERAEPARMFKFPWSALAKKELSESDAIAAISIPVFAQGAAFDTSGALWIMRSGSTLGELVKLDRKTGAVIMRFDMPVGAEGISFAPDGSLWTLSEAGSRRWSHWKGFYPLAFQFDMKLLK